MKFRILTVKVVKGNESGEFYIVQRKKWGFWVYFTNESYNKLDDEFSLFVKDAQKFHICLQDGNFTQNKYIKENKSKIDYLKYICQIYAESKAVTKYEITVVDEFEIKN